MIKDSNYNPATDPLMGRITKKFNPLQSTTSNFQRGPRLNTHDSKMAKY